jgi:hypothetical protein
MIDPKALTAEDIGRRIQFKFCKSDKPISGTIHEIKGSLIRVMFDKYKKRKNYKGTLCHPSNMEFV